MIVYIQYIQASLTVCTQSDRYKNTQILNWSHFNQLKDFRKKHHLNKLPKYKCLNKWKTINLKQKFSQYSYFSKKGWWTINQQQYR